MASGFCFSCGLLLFDRSAKERPQENEQIRVALEPESLGDQEEAEEEEQYVTLQAGEPAMEGIFLLEGHGQPRLTFRMWCALESASRAHPHQPVTLLMTSPVIKRSLLLQNLTGQLPNMRLLHLDTRQLFHGSPLEDWYGEGRWRESQWPLFHFNDALRCELELPSGRTPGCPDVAVLPPRSFYPLPWWEWQRYVKDDPGLSDDLLGDPRVFVLHVWNLHTRHALVRLSSQQPYARAARASCPVTVAHAGPLM
ncbi:lactosylceramide 4-alpha-galactosyltransferase-like isoform X2 [Panulirus ornatus]|uniref:lactosylceramide 4-alpha-galactosyltransferase-like isoform X2 n=1 Tax=Panulirus ornatus TaxID=150431 RepID=UPI003A861E93